MVAPRPGRSALAIQTPASNQAIGPSRWAGRGKAPMLAPTIFDRHRPPCRSTRSSATGRRLSRKRVRCIERRWNRTYRGKYQRQPRSANITPRPHPRVPAFGGRRGQRNLQRIDRWERKLSAAKTALTEYSNEKMAETEGFEPSVAHSGYDGLANRWFQPLTHVSARICPPERRAVAREAPIASGLRHGNGSVRRFFARRAVTDSIRPGIDSGRRSFIVVSASNPIICAMISERIFGEFRA